MYEQLLEGLGLAKNEARIYETLLTEGESPVGQIANKSKVHRRNVYDTLQRLMEKGLVFEILEHKENRYQAVDPKKLSEVLQDKQTVLNKSMPDLEKLYESTPTSEAVYIYRGLEGWKNYARDILRIGEDDYIMGGKGVWSDPKIKSFIDQFAKEAARKNIKFHMLVDESARSKVNPIAAALNASARIIPAKFYAPSAFEIFGDHIVFLSDCTEGILRDDISITVVVNKKLADSFRAWFNFMWSASLPMKK